MNYQYDRVEKTKFIINIIQTKRDEIYGLWTDILYTYVDRIKDSWNDNACQTYVEKLRDVNYIMDKIIRQLDELIEAWERYYYKEGELTPDIEDLVSTLSKTSYIGSIDYENDTFGGYFN